MTELEIQTRRDMEAPPAAVWRALTDFTRYAAWNPMVLEATGHAAAGERARLRYRSSIGLELRFDVRITHAEPERELRWVGTRLGIAGDHYFRLRATPTGTELVHGEVFTGPYVRAVGFAFRQQLPVFRRFDRALEAEAKQLAREEDA